MYPHLLPAVLGLGQQCLVNAGGFQTPVNASQKLHLDWDAAGVKARDFVTQLTLDEKLQMVTGNATGGGCTGNIDPIPRISFPGLCLLDGPATIGRNELVSVFPAGVTTAATWDRTLMHERGRALGAEFKAKGAHIALGYVNLDPRKQPR